jgi:hypothetical protein
MESILFLCCIILYYIINTVIQKIIFYYYTNLNKSLSNDRKFYISKNIGKSIILFILSCIGYNTVYNAIKFNIWDNNNIHIIGTIYASHDILSLFIAFWKLPLTTRLHHISVLFLAYKNLYTDYTQPTIWRGMVIYAYLSALSYYVNTFLGLRFLLPKYKIWFLAKISFILYLILCIFNWSYQLLVLYNNITSPIIEIIIFCSLIGLIVYDDIILLNYLYNF